MESDPMAKQRSASDQTRPSASSHGGALLAEAKLRRLNTQLRRLALQLTLAQERERRRIAQGLHDGVGQLLLLAHAKLAQLGQATHDGVPAQAREIRALLDHAIRDTRSLTFELTSPVLFEFGLVAATESLCEQLGRESGVRFRVKVESAPGPLGEDLLILLYRAVRELCWNVVKHAQALFAEVRLSTLADRIQIVVADDGEGFDFAEYTRRIGPEAGLGLFGIREACDHLGGSFEVESSPDKGTHATLIVPFV